MVWGGPRGVGCVATLDIPFRAQMTSCVLSLHGPCVHGHEDEWQAPQRRCKTQVRCWETTHRGGYRQELLSSAPFEGRTPRSARPSTRHDIHRVLSRLCVIRAGPSTMLQLPVTVPTALPGPPCCFSPMPPSPPCPSPPFWPKEHLTYPAPCASVPIRRPPPWRVPTWRP